MMPDQCRMLNAECTMPNECSWSIGHSALSIRLCLTRPSEDLHVVRPAGGVAREADADFGVVRAEDIGAVTGGAHPRVHDGFSSALSHRDVLGIGRPLITGRGQAILGAGILRAGEDVFKTAEPRH